MVYTIDHEKYISKFGPKEQKITCSTIQTELGPNMNTSNYNQEFYVYHQ